MEIYKLIPGFERYAIYSVGFVKNLKTGRVLKPDLISVGYEAVRLCNNGKQRREYIHRLVAFAFVPNPDGKPFVNHKNGNKLDNSVGNLEWSTPKENIRHAYAIGLVPSLTKALQSSKLTVEQVKEIRASSLSTKDLAPLYKVSIATIQSIVYRHTWRFI